jgi:CheY-like chemotaxis protein
MANILIVDDEDGVREVIKEAVDIEGHTTFEAATGARAFEILKSKTIDLAIVDRNMPGMSGIEMVELMRRDPKMKLVKVLMCTGSSVTKEIDQAFAAGADDYILKPINFTQLVAKVAKALASPPRSPL